MNSQQLLRVTETASNDVPRINEPRAAFGLRVLGRGRKRSSTVSRIGILVYPTIENASTEYYRVRYTVGTFSFDFDSRFDDFVASSLPMGLGAHLEAAVVWVVRPMNEDLWSVIVSYPDALCPTLLWRENGLPEFASRRG